MCRLGYSLEHSLWRGETYTQIVYGCSDDEEDVKAIKAAYDKKVGHETGHGQIYFVLHRHGWSKKLPRSKHPKSATPEAIDASKKLTPEFMS